MKHDDFKNMLIEWKGIIVETHTISKGLVERTDRHAIKYDQFFNKIFQELDDMKEDRHKDKQEIMEEIALVKIDSAKQAGATNTKIAGISGTVHVLMAIIMAGVKKLFL